jgi:hypothetical protein
MTTNTDVVQDKRQIATLDFAEQLFTKGDRFMGPRQIGPVLGRALSVVPPIPFTVQELQRAYQQGDELRLQPPDLTAQQIISAFRNTTMHGRILCFSEGLMAGEKFWKEPMVPGWRLCATEILDGSEHLNYLQQTALLTEEVGRMYGAKPPQMVADAVVEFHANRKLIKDLMRAKQPDAAARLVALAINQLFRSSPVELVYELTLKERMSRDRRLSDKLDWTNAIDGKGAIIRIGNFRSNGFEVGGCKPPSCGIGVRLCRRVPLW